MSIPLEQLYFFVLQWNSTVRIFQILVIIYAYVLCKTIQLIEDTHRSDPFRTAQEIEQTMAEILTLRRVVSPLTVYQQ